MLMTGKSPAGTLAIKTSFIPHSWLYWAANASIWTKLMRMKISTFLTFVGDQCGKAEEAINFYVSVFPNSEIKSLIRYAEGEPGGTPELIKFGVIRLNGVEYLVSESNYKHPWSFTPGVSLFVACHSEEEIDALFEKLSSDGGQIMVPLDNYRGQGDYGFGKKFGWCADKFGISWQLNLSDERWK